MSPPRVCFLGLCQNFIQVTTDAGMPIATNVLGLTDQVISALYPVSLDGLGLAISIFEPANTENAKLVFRDQARSAQFEINHILTLSGEGNAEALTLGRGWIRVFGKAPKNIVVAEPSQFAVFLKSDSEKEEFLGYVNFHYSEPPSLNDAAIEAIKADPFAKKFVRFTLSCNKCRDQLRCYTGIQRGGDSEAQGWIWQDDLGDAFVCKCGTTNVPLKYLKKGLHTVLSRSDGSALGMTTMVALYEKSALQEYCREFAKLLDATPKEETLQQFLDEHKVFLHRFAALQILTKPPILSKFNADFIVLNNRKELLLIEIEQANVRLLKRNKNSFGVTAALQHAIDQVRSWRHVFDDFRDAALANLDIDKKQVAKIKGVVICGRTPNDAVEERYLRALDLDVELYTYDDLISDVVESIRHISST